MRRMIGQHTEHQYLKHHQREVFPSTGNGSGSAVKTVYQLAASTKLFYQPNRIIHRA